MHETQLPNRFSIFHHGPARGPAYDAWRDGICRGFCRLDVGPADDNRIDCRNEFVLLDSIAIATPTGSSARFARTRDLLDDGCDDLVLVSATRGKVRVTQGAKAIDLTAGQMCLTEMNIIGGVDLNRSGGFRTTRIPRRLLLHVAPSAETQLARTLGHDRALSAMKADALKNLGNGDLTLEAVARANGVSTRQAQRMFASSGTTFTDFVLDQRLLLARRLLRDGEMRHRKVSDIAFAVGFNDLSYFNRSFKRRFGVTPSDLQAAPGPQGNS